MTSFQSDPARAAPGAAGTVSRRAALGGAGGMIALSMMAAPDGAQAQGAAPAPPAPQVRRTADGQTFTAAIARYAAGTSLEKVPAPARERAKKVIFDELACGYYGRRSPGGVAATRYVEGCGSPAEARIYGTALRASAPYAAMANGTAGHGDEVDGTHVIGGHPGASIVHAVAAIADKQDVSGAEFLNAVILGYDVGVRMVEACGGVFGMRDGKHLTSDFLYAMGCTAAAARILRLDPMLHCHALALVTFQANGVNALFSEKHHVSKSFCNGQFAFAAISSAQMAQKGLEGNEDIIGSYEGVLDAWGDGRHDDAVTKGLGTDFKIMGANFKFYNAGYPIHTPVEAALTLIRQNRIPLDTIQSIAIGMPANPLKVVDNRPMHNISVQDMVTAYVVGGGLKLADEPFPAMLDNPVYRRLRPLVSASVDPDLQREFPNGRGARVTITTRDGQRRSLRIDNPRGHSLRGEVAWEDLGEKWRGSLPGCDPTGALALARRLEELKSAREIFAAFAGVNA